MELKEIKSSDIKLLNKATDLISKYSWGHDYPVRPIDEILRADYRIGAMIADELVGFGTVGFGFGPDKLDNDQLWIAHAVVLPKFRQQGIFREIFNAQLSYAKNKNKRIMTCTDNQIIINFLLKNGWKELRQTIDESGKASKVFEYK
ncbi:MAG: GNAT family N-acetyltransferase [Burkholderiales bacterium]|nr:GNAT family N-acetyltransferase [Burkholderiales bacterium]